MTSPAGRERGFRLVALGDSITAGVGDTIGLDAVHGPGWAAHLAAVLGVEAFTNLATNGARSRDVAETQLGQALALRPRLATVLVGGNDVLRSDFDARLTLADLRRCVEDLCRAGTDVVLVRLPVIGLFELAPRLVRRVMRRRVAAINAAVDEVANAPGASSVPCAGSPASSVACTEIGPSIDRSQGKGPNPERGSSNGPSPVWGRVVVVDAARAIEPAGAKAWHVDRVHPSPAGHRRLSVAAAIALSALDGVLRHDESGVASRPVATPFSPADDLERVLVARLPDAPDPPTARQRLAWLVQAGLPWCVRRGRDFLPGLLRAVVHDLRAERVLTQGGMVTSLADSGLDPRRRLGRG